MNRLLSRVGVRVASVGLLVAGVVGGVYLGQGHEIQPQAQQVQPRSADAPLLLQADAGEMQLLKERHSRHAAQRAYRQEAEGDAAAKAAAQAKAAATKARKLEKKAIDKKVAEEKKAAEAKKAAESAAAAASASASGSSGGGSTAFTGEIPSSCSEYSGNREIGCALMLEAGFGIDQFPCLNKLWDRESGWSATAHNDSSGAHGIPQALPGSKMASVGSDWRNGVTTQIKWGLGYIEGRYGTPCKAWAHSESSGWY